MGKGENFDKFQDYLKSVRRPEDDRCAMCGKTPDEIRAEFFEYMEHPAKEHEGLELDDLVIMSYKISRPICAACYFVVKNNPELVKEILEKPEDEVWS